jgi:glutamate-ammonia-ligase adenylyltransferase
MALSQLVKLFAASPWIGMLLTHHPVLLDELLDVRTLYQLLDRQALEDELLQELQKLDYDDLEQQMEALRYFKQSHVLHVAAADISHAMPLMKVSDHLTEIAEVVLDEVLQIALNAMAVKHGYPRCSPGHTKACTPGFCIIAYGKMGGIELGYGSDLDLVFLHDSRGEHQKTGGKKPIDNAVFFARLGQRIIHILNTLTPSGILYEVDMRLRPSGASGLLVSDMDAFAEYQRDEAWTWEHQALVRARPVVGDEGVAKQFTAVRHEILCRKRDAAELKKEVREMRERMRAELSRSKAGKFDIKQGCGGIADIEFMVQYGVLCWAHKYPDLTEFTDNIRILEGLERNGLMSAAEAALLSDAYRNYRARSHRLALQEESAIVGVEEFSEIRTQVAALWKQWMEE